LTLAKGPTSQILAMIWFQIQGSWMWIWVTYTCTRAS